MSGAVEVAERVRRFRPYPEYRESGVEWLGDTPGHWEVRKATHLFEIGSGTTPKSEDQRFYGGDIPWITTSELRETVVSSTKKTVSAAALREYSSLKLHPISSLAIAMYGATIGRLGILGVAATVNQACCVFTPSANMTTDFAFFAFQMARRYLISLGTGGGQPNLSQDVLRALRIPTPPLDEQRVIAEFLDRETGKIDALVAKKERLIELLEEKRTALITHAVTKGLDPTAVLKRSGNDIFPMLPAGWEIRKIRRLLRRIVRPVDVDPSEVYREIGVRSWGKGVFHKDPLWGAQLDGKRIFSVHPGDLVFNIVFAWEGAVAVLTEREAGMVGSHRFPTFRHDRDQVDLDYLLMILQTAHGRALMGLNSPGAAGRNKTLRLGSFLDEEIPLPPPETQRQVVTRVREEERRLAVLVKKSATLVDRLKEFRAALISAAVTGKIDVREEAA